MVSRGDDLSRRVESDTGAEYPLLSARSEAYRRASEYYAADGDPVKAAEAKVEYLVFAFRETETFGSGGYFGPRYTKSDGTPFPDFYSLPPNTQSYLKSRAEATGNPIHKARYADFLWDKFRDKDAGMMAVKAYVDCATLAANRGDGNAAYRAGRRASHLARHFGDRDLKVIAKTALLELVHRFVSSFDLNYVPKVAESLLNVSDVITPEEMTEIIGRLEMLRALYVNSKDFFQERSALKVLRQLYKLNGDEDGERKALLAEGESYENEGDYRLEQKGAGGGPEAAANLYQLALSHYLDMGEAERVESVKRKLKTAHGRAPSNFQSFVEALRASVAGGRTGGGGTPGGSTTAGD